jgi:hypothetical protein
MIVDQVKLNQIFNELLFRNYDDMAQVYLKKEEEFVREEVGKSQERKNLIALVNAAKNL